MQKLFIFLIGIILLCNATAQTPIHNYEIGYHFDINQQLIEGYHDFDYNPKKALKVKYKIGVDYTPGCYYTKDGQKISGYLKLSKSTAHFKFKTLITDKPVTKKPSDCSAYVIGIDSFSVIEGFDIQRTLLPLPAMGGHFAEVLDEFDNITFYKHTFVGVNSNVITYLAWKRGQTKPVSFPKLPASFQIVALDFFGNDKMLRNEIDKGKYKERDIPDLIKLLKYRNRVNQQKEIFFNANWDETDNPADYEYYTKIEHLNDSIYHAKYYYTIGIPIYEGYYTTIFPQVKSGDFNWFYPSGEMRKKILFYDNKPGTHSTYFKNGNMHRLYRIFEEQPYYIQVNDINGNNLLDVNGNGVEVFLDSINNRQITYEYTSHRLSNAHYLGQNNQKTYQIIDTQLNSRVINKLRSKIKSEIQYPENSILNNSQGYILVKCFIEPSGIVSDIQIIKGLDPECDNAILKCLSSIKGEKILRRAKVNGVLVAREIIIPVHFTIEGFSRTRYNHMHYHMNRHMWMHNQMHRHHFAPPPTNFRF